MVICELIIGFDLSGRKRNSRQAEATKSGQFSGFDVYRDLEAHTLQNTATTSIIAFLLELGLNSHE